MKIIQVGSFPISLDCIRGGVESSVYGLANTLSLADQVHVFDVPRIGEKDREEVCGNMIVHRYANHGKHNQDAVKRVQEMVVHIMLLQPDVVHIHSTGQLSYLLYKALKDKGIRMMLTVHGLLHVEKMNILKRKFSLKHLYQCVVQSYYEFKILNCAKQIIVDTHYVAKQIEAYKQSGFIKNLPEMHVIPQGINEKFLELQSSPTSRTILSVGSISKRKGHLYLLQAFDLLCQKLDDVNLVIAGVLAEQSYYQEILAYVQNSPNADKIKILTNLPQEELFKLYTQAQIFALHTQEESQGIVFAEAMATGMPVVATNVGGVPYVVQDKTVGFLSMYGDTKSFSNNIHQLLTEDDTYKMFSSVATIYAQNYLWKSIANKAINVYNTLD